MFFEICSILPSSYSRLALDLLSLFTRSGNVLFYINAPDLSFKIRCKDNIKLANVFLQGRKFFQKIDFFSFFRFFIEPNEDNKHASRRYLVLFCDLVSCLMCGSPSVTCDEIIIDNGLVSEFNLMPFR